MQQLRQQRASVHRSMAGTCAPSVCLHGGLSEVAERRGRAYILNHEWLQCEHCVAHAVFRTFTRRMVTRTKRHVIPTPYGSCRRPFFEFKESNSMSPSQSTSAMLQQVQINGSNEKNPIRGVQPSKPRRSQVDRF